MENAPTCAICRWHRDGECRRYPPTVQAYRTEATKDQLGDAVTYVESWESRWPAVSPTDGCGEHTPMASEPTLEQIVARELSACLEQMFKDAGISSQALNDHP